MILQQGERPIASEFVQAVVGEQVQSGYLYLTNARLVFEGLFFESSVGWVPRTLLDLHVVQISNVVAIAGRSNRHTLRVEAGRGYVYTFVTPNAPSWASSLVQAKQSAPPMVAHVAHSAAPVPVVVNIRQEPTQPTVFLHCKHCGSLAAAGSVHCTSCGASL
jgi:hypothetical protein